MSDDLNGSQGGNEGGNNDGGTGGGGQQTITYTQAELDAAMAKNRRGVQAKLAEAEKKAKAYDALQSKVSGFLEGEGGEGYQDLDHFREATDTILRETQSEVETLRQQSDDMTKKLNAERERANLADSRFANAMIQRQIADDAADLVVEGAGREGAVEYFQLKLGSVAEFNAETGEVGVKWKVMDEETGRTEEKIVTVKQALKDMEANPSKYGRYFRSTVNGGAGGETVDGVQRHPDGGLDFGRIDFNKFKELAKKNPQALREAADKLTL